MCVRRARLGAAAVADVPGSTGSSPPRRNGACRPSTPLASALGLPIEIDDRLSEVDYGEWTGRALKDLAGEPLWRVVQHHPSAAVFPGGEGLAAVSARAAAAIRDVRAGGRPSDQTVLVCSHGDVIKAILADALGLHLDSFQRIVVAPASISVDPVHPAATVRRTDQRHRRSGLAQTVGCPVDGAAGGPSCGTGSRRSSGPDRRVGRRPGRGRHLTAPPVPPGVGRPLVA